LILKSATVPPNPHGPQLAELLCQSGEWLGNSLAHNSFADTDGEMLMNSSELQLRASHFPFFSHTHISPLPEPAMLGRRTKDRADVFFQRQIELDDYMIRAGS